MQTETQQQMIYDALINGWHITPIEALREFGCFRLAARIHDLRSLGVRIETLTRDIGDGRTVAEYYMREEERQKWIRYTKQHDPTF
jgi:hypothetical protein